MRRGHFNIVTDGMWGSCGKGLITTYLASKHRPEIISTTNMPNAGHTAVWDDGSKFIAKALPSATALIRWIPGYLPLIVIGPSAAFDITQLQDEITACHANYSMVIHPRAGIITEYHKSAESTEGGTKHVASTMQGCGTFLADKIMRRQDLRLARDYDQLAGHLACNLPKKLPFDVHGLDPDCLPSMLAELLRFGYTILHEGSQGFSLDINHGSHYPHCTSRSTTALQNLTDMGLPAKTLGDIYLVIRPYPIRVGNVVEDGETKGYSGDCYDDHKELTWADVSAAAGAPPEVTKGELTTVTKRLRRVFSFSKKQVKQAALINGATKIALNFANYLDWSCFGCNEWDKLPQKVLDFITMVEDLTSVPVTLVGTGPQNNNVCSCE